ncbi:MAG TPA: hypothetical protein VHN11_04460 [Xanthobacteraceae bacterium]|jgi:hypothetical protein|nr:hypothetical protein [Xanthobacteraceae bacterium]
MRRLFLPTARQLNVLIPIGLIAVGYALYMRYLVIEQTPVGLACDGGLQTWLCATRRTMIALFQHWVFGSIAIGAAALNLIRPSIVLFAIGLAAAALGIVLYNVGLSALAVALLIISFARPVTESN